ncbi:NF038130 family PEP-CTERM protein [Roseofilum capinflatum]|uniref:NF038130 family PEP-CTERM protein n=1 Tax=Roseofilum capinflatum BLCC-M114 TaxID=3022440 RepID=A0ABT7B9I4_9CYAN|nr:NF038130 family PEP-CTERM protein [Roseofilum capinflatum]MDJ1175844.1 NF038130 family PEP-CTERM protein [Roseofilum capinflatum BLCC-M114]
MFNSIKKIAMGASVVAGVSVLGAPAFAGTLTGVSTTGDVRVFEQISGTEVQLSGSNGSAAIIDALGSAGSVELDDNIDYGWGNETASTLTANFTDGSIMFGSVGAADWVGGLGTTWYNGLYSNYTAQLNAIAAAGSLDASNANVMVGALETMGVFQRLSDPNIQSVSSNNGEYSFELAGHNNFASGLDLEVTDPMYGLLSKMMASEVVKYSLDGGTNWDYAYSFGTPGSAGAFDKGSYASGVVDAGDGFSFTRNYQFTVGTPNPDPVDVPEPSALLGLAAIGGLVVAAKRRKNA